jgi:hypothetical protein
MTKLISPTIKQRFIALHTPRRSVFCLASQTFQSQLPIPTSIITALNISTKLSINMQGPYFSFWPMSEVQSLKSVVHPCMASTHLPAYNIIGAAPRLRCAEDDIPARPVTRRSNKSSSASSSRKGGAASKRTTTPVTRENLFKISMVCAREEDLDAPFSVVSQPMERRRTGSETSASSSDLPSITEEEE